MQLPNQIIGFNEVQMVKANQDISHAMQTINNNTARIDTEMAVVRNRTIAMMVATVSLMYDLDDNETWQLNGMMQADAQFVNMSDPIMLRARLVQYVYDIKGRRPSGALQRH